MTKLTTERLDKLQDNLLQFQGHYSDPADKENYDIFVDALHMLDEFKAAKEKILAYEQAADRPVGEIFRCSGNKTLRWWNDVPEGAVLYASPILPKQPDEITFEQAMLESYKLSPAEAYQKAWKAAIQSCAQPVIPEQELNTAKLINKFYERYPLETFANDSERAEALGYFMAGAELQCFGEFIAYDDHMQESE